MKVKPTVKILMVFAPVFRMIQIEKGRIHQRVVSQGFDANLTEVSNRGTQTPPDDVPVQASGLEKASAMAENSELVVAVKNKFIAQKLEESGINNPKKQSPVGKTPSSVRNMISAFETNLSQVYESCC